MKKKSKRLTRKQRVEFLKTIFEEIIRREEVGIKSDNYRINILIG